MNSRKRILIIENSRHVTGALKSICAMANDLRNDFEFIFILPSRSASVSWLKKYSFDVIELPMLEISKSWRSLLYLPMLFINARRLRKIINAKKIDIVHSNDLYNLLGPLLKFFGMKIAYVCHVRFLPGGFPSWLFEFWMSRQLSSAGRVIAVSDFLKKQLSHNKKIVRIYDRMLPGNEVTGKRNGNTILYLSNIIPGKGHDEMITAFAKTRAKFPGWKLRIVGSDMGLEKNRRYREELKEYAIGLKIENAIEWNDFVDDVALEYASADIFANFSSSESFSMTCLEAQFYGCCAVATTSGGPAEIISDNESGMLVPVGDTSAMTNALETLMGDPELRKTMGDRGADIVRKKFGPSNTSAVLRSVYNEVCNGHQSRQ